MSEKIPRKFEIHDEDSSIIAELVSFIETILGQTVWMFYDSIDDYSYLVLYIGEKTNKRRARRG